MSDGDGVEEAANAMARLFDRISVLCTKLSRENAKLRLRSSVETPVLTEAERRSLCDAYTYLSSREDGLVSDEMIGAMEKAICAFGGQP